MNLQEVQDRFGKILTLQKQGDHNKALRLLDELLVEEPGFVQGWLNRAAYLDRVGAHFDSILNYDRAVALNPTKADYYNDRGVAYLSLKAYQKALDDFEHALDLDKYIPEGWNNKGIIYRRMGRNAESMPCFREAIKLKPDYADAHLGLSMCALEVQQFEEGWKEFEWRFQSGHVPPRALPQPVWEGEKAASKDDALLIYCEQGFGDSLQFMRYIKHARERWGGRVYVETRVPLFRIMSRLEGVDGVVVLGEKIPVNVKKQIALLSVPRVVGTELGFEGAYLKQDPLLIDYWKGMLKVVPQGVRVGICWAGENRENNPIASSIDARRSMSLADFTDLAKVKGITWFSLQKGAPAPQVKTPPIGMNIADFTPEFQDFADTAALIHNLDLVITVDTAVAHVAAATGKPTWMLSRFDGCWRWFGKRPDSPWYPSMTLFHQQKEGDWSAPLETMWRQLQAFVVERRAHAA